MLEAAQYGENSFVTLTYDDDNLPADNSVSPRELTLFIKRLRKELDTQGHGRVRYFGCGEYGERSGRPHYHLALFNYGPCFRGRTEAHRPSCCVRCDLVARAWGKGKIDVGNLEQSSAAYVAGYVTKKWTKAKQLNVRHPEFARMSLRPGIGLGMAHEIASCLLETKLDERMIDVPLSLQHGRAQWPLGRYLRRKLRTYIGRHPNAPLETVLEADTEMQNVRETAWNSKTSVKAEVLKRSLGRRIQIEARERRSRKREAI